MAGVPYHSAQQYIDVPSGAWLQGCHAEQMEILSRQVGVVKREGCAGDYPWYSGR